MIITNLYSDIYPQIAEWGENKAHVPLNIREEKTLDEKGKEKIGYRYDLVEKVELPINEDNILKAAINTKFTQEEQNYITRNFMKSNDEKVNNYKSFLSSIQEKINNTKNIVH